MKASKFSDAQKASILKRGRTEFPLRRSAVGLGLARRPTTTEEEIRLAVADGDEAAEAA